MTCRLRRRQNALKRNARRRRTVIAALAKTNRPRKTDRFGPRGRSPKWSGIGPIRRCATTRRRWSQRIWSKWISTLCRRPVSIILYNILIILSDQKTRMMINIFKIFKNNFSVYTLK